MRVRGTAASIIAAETAHISGINRLNMTRIISVLGFFLIPFAMKYLQATTVSIYTNLQPVIASFVAIMLGQDVLTWDKPVAGVLVLLSAYIVTVVTAKDTKG